MAFNKIFIKLSSVIMIIFLIVLLPLGFIMNKIFTNAYMVQIEQETNQISEKYAAMIHSLGGMNLMMIQPLSQMTNKNVIIANRSGKVIVNTGVTHFSLSENQVNTLKRNKDINTLVTIKDRGHYFISGHSLVNNQGDMIGSVLVFTSVEDIYGTLKKVRNLLILSSVGAFLIALGFTYITSRRLSLPLIEMEHATRKMAKGDLSARVQIQTNDEMGSLAKAINNLAYEIENYRKTRQEFFANISHELKTPITYLAGYGKVLKEKRYETDIEQEQYIEIIESEANRLNHLINDLFELSKMEEGRISLYMEPVDLTEVLENVIQMVQLSAKEKGIEIKRNFDPHIYLINGDGGKLEQIFINIISNAIRYTDEGSVLITISQITSNAVVSVKDTGIGIPEKDIPFVFDRFYRIEKSRSRHYGGTGLGLSIVKTLVELHKGTIDVQSNEGVGTTFKVVFPTIDRVTNNENI